MRFYLVDAFTEEAFAGNTAGVVLLDEPADSAWMQSVATELKHSETAFVVLADEGPLELRWFTPASEVDLCGHATLATAHVLGGDRVFDTKSGPLHCTTHPDGRVEMDFPADPPAPAPVDLRSALATALPGVRIEYCARGVSDLLVVASEAAEVRRLQPDFAELATLPVRGVIVTARSDIDGVDYVSRCFYPAKGIDEDPVTGSAHCTLAAYWSPRLGADDLIGAQLSTRGGRVRTVLRGDRVGLTGNAVTIASGELLV